MLSQRCICPTAFSSRRQYPPLASARAQEIDALVYELYGLTEEEIAAVEGRDH